MSRTAVLIVVGLVLVVIFLAVGVLVRAVGIRRAAEDFVLVWFALAAGNLAVGVFDAGYSFVEELPIFLLVFAVPALVAGVAWHAARRRDRSAGASS